ncbi:DUF397 domain-containing protein [Streptomyces sp. NPDC008150]|uniref:DUF397 domain-containing protein n=1 Tax=Streptomyces sp. NPDC008150 TaxID=3364816 RepID=UPI0036E3561D
MPAEPLAVQGLVWFKSSHSGGNATECVECAVQSAGMLIRDSKAAGGPIVAVGADQWTAFVRASASPWLGTF